MLELKEATEGLIFASVILSKNFSEVNMDEIWCERYQLAGKFYPQFNPSLGYYSKEMGEELQRIIYYSFESFKREEMIGGKLWATEKEAKLSLSDKRTVNIDIGLLTRDQMLLSTSKPYAHRIYLRNGVYADLNYIYENKSYQFLPWTYPDYRHEEKLRFFNWLREGLF